MEIFKKHFHCTVNLKLEIQYFVVEVRLFVKPEDDTMFYKLRWCLVIQCEMGQILA